MKRLIAIALCLVAVTAQAANIFDRPLLPAPTDAARLYIYDPDTNTDRNITWGGLRSFFAPSAPPWATIADKPTVYPPKAHNQSADSITDGVNNKAYTATEKTKLATIQTGATANSTDEYLLNRANHTGFQNMSTVTGLEAALVGKIDSTDSRLSDPRTPLAHNQTADTITDGVNNKAYTATEKSKLATIQAGATVQVNADWLATSGITQILNKPAETCNGRYAWDGSQIYIVAGGCTAGTGYEGDVCIDSVAPNIIYQRLNNTWDVKGTLQGSPGWPGVDGRTYSCTITGGIRSLLYDKNGANPAPTMVAFGVELREDGDIITPESYSWSVPASGSLLSGSSIVSTFMPTVAGTFSAGAADNRVDVTVTYAGQTCSATAPVPATKIGNDGAQGSDNKQQIYGKIAAGSTGDVLRTQCGPDDLPDFVAREVRDPLGNVILAYTCGGKVTVYQLPGESSSAIKLAVKGLDGIDHFSVTAGGTVVLR